jgi:hypothetical protein
VSDPAAYVWVVIAACGGGAPTAPSPPIANRAATTAAPSVITHLHPRLVGFDTCPATVNIFVDSVVASTLEVKCPTPTPYVPGKVVWSSGPDVVDAPAFAVPPGRHTVRVEFAGDKAERTITFPVYESFQRVKGKPPLIAEQLRLRISDEGMFVDEPVVEMMTF